MAFFRNLLCCWAMLLIATALAGCQATCTEVCNQQNDCLGKEVHGDPTGCTSQCESDRAHEDRSDIVESSIVCFASASCDAIAAGDCESGCEELCDLSASADLASSVTETTSECRTTCGQLTADNLQCLLAKKAETWAQNCKNAVTEYQELVTTVVPTISETTAPTTSELTPE